MNKPVISVRQVGEEVYLFMSPTKGNRIPVAKPRIFILMTREHMNSDWQRLYKALATQGASVSNKLKRVVKNILKIIGM